MRDPTAHARATYADLEALPPNMVGQIIDGVLVAHPRPALGHARVASRLGGNLDGPFDRGRGGPGGWILLDEPELHLGADVLVPDLAGWRRERYPAHATADVPFLTVAPDWVCEVLSPRTARVDKVAKRRVYAREQVAFVWHIEPVERVLTAYRLAGADFTELGVWSPEETPLVRVPPFDAVELDLASLWADVAPSPAER